MPMESAWQTQDESDQLLMWFTCTRVCVHMSTVVHAWEPVLRKARMKLELKRVLFWLDAPVLIGCNFWVEPEDTCVKTWKFPSPASEAGAGIALCTSALHCVSPGVCLSVWDAFVWAGSVVSSSGGWDMFKDFIDIFPFVLLLHPKNPHVYFILVLFCPILWFGEHINKMQIYKKAICISFMFLMPRFCSIIAIFLCACFSQANKLDLMRSFSLCKDHFSMKRER